MDDFSYKQPSIPIALIDRYAAHMDIIIIMLWWYIIGLLN